MDRKTNSSGRGKHVSGSSGSVSTHGEGLNLGGSSRDNKGSVSGGNRSAGSYGTPSRKSSSGSSLLSLFTSNSSSSKKKKKILLIVVAIIAVVLIYTYCKNKQQPVDPDPQGSHTESYQDSSLDSEPTSEDEDDESEITGTARRYYTDTKNAENVTLMIYMCGADLESNYGCATADLKEMLNANFTDNVNVIVATGGARSWRNNWVSANKNQYFKLEQTGPFNKTLTEIKSMNKASMTDPNTLSSFIQFCKKEYPADRYCLIFWDHGGGSVTGYGHDENFTSSGSMTLDKINSALKAGGVKFDFIGFDACLMANIETAVVCENYADYLIASEETEPGGGWYYTKWLTSLFARPNIDTVELGKKICDDFYSNEKQNGNVSLSVIDLAEFSGKPMAAFANFSTYLTKELSGSNYSVVSSARAGTKEFAASSKINQIDLIHFAKKLGSSKATNFISSFDSCIKYNRTTISNAYGMSVYFPYTSTAYVGKVLTIYEKIDMPDEYANTVRNFASILTGGQISSTSTGSSSGSLTGDQFANTISSPTGSGVTDLLSSFLGTSSSSGSALDTILGTLGGGTGSSGSMLGTLFDVFGSSGSSTSSGYGSIISSLFGSDSNSTSSSLLSVGSDLIGSLFGTKSTSLDRQVMFDNADFYASTLLNASDLKAAKKGSKYVLKLSDDQWENIQDVMLNMFIKDANGGFIDLGWDPVYEFDEDGDLVLTLDDMTWLAINDQFVAAYCYETIYDDNGALSELYYRVPCLVKSAQDNVTRKADILIVSTKSNDWCFKVKDVVYGYDSAVTFAKTEDEDVHKLAAGDEIYFIADYYTADGTFDNQYIISDAPIINGNDGFKSLAVTDKPIESRYGVFTNYRLTDIFNNAYWTQTLKNNSTVVK